MASEQHKDAVNVNPFSDEAVGKPKVEIVGKVCESCEG